MVRILRVLGFVVLLAGLLTVNAYFLNYNAFRTFKFFDWGAFLDCAWRIFQGQRPYVDFVLTLGPIHFWIHVIFFKIFGFGKMAILSNMVVVSSVVIGAVSFLAYKRLPLLIVFFVGVLTMTSYYWPFSHPWYDYSANLFTVIALTIFLLQHPFKSKRHTACISYLMGCLVLMCFMTKPNIGAAFGAFMFVVMVALPYRKHAVMAYLAGVLTMLVVLRVTDIIPSYTEFFSQTVLGYGGHHKGRAMKLILQPSHWLMNHYWVLILAVVLVLRREILERRILFLVFMGVYAVDIFSTATTGAVVETHAPLMGLFFAIGFILLRGDGSIAFFALPLMRRLVILGAIVGSIALSVSFTHHGLALTQWSFAERKLLNNPQMDPEGTYSINNPVLQGWKTDNWHGEAVDRFSYFIQKYVPEDETIIVMTDLQILNALTGRATYKNAPWIFSVPDVPQGKYLHQFVKRFKEDPPDWVVTHHKRIGFADMIMYQLGLQKHIIDHYEIVIKIGNYAMLRRVGLTPLKI